MIGALLVSVALADEPATYERLFGDQPDSPAQAAEPTEPSPWGLLGAAALGAVGLVGLWRLRVRPPGPGIGRPLEILGRYPLGDRSALVLVEVLDADGERRRLLVGTGQGAPVLVSDLGSTGARNVVDEVLDERRGDLRRGAAV